MLTSRVSSACITSIIRTYYTWKIIHSQDVTYDMCRMCLWNSAEISIGIIVCCLPVSPRFFQFIGPKIYGTFSAHKNNNVFTGSKRAFTKNSASATWADPYNARVQLKSESIALAQQTSRTTERESTGGSVSMTEGRQTKTHDHLKSGSRGIRVDRTMDVDVEANTTAMTSSDQAEQQMKMGW